MARTYLYRLDVTYPPGSDEPDWAPPGWGADESHWEQEADTGAAVVAPFVWPRARTYMSRAAARRRAALLESYGATVAVCRSLPVVWPDAEDVDGGETVREYGVHLVDRDPHPVQLHTAQDTAEAELARVHRYGIRARLMTRTATYGPWKAAEDGGEDRG